MDNKDNVTQQKPADNNPLLSVQTSTPATEHRTYGFNDDGKQKKENK